MFGSLGMGEMIVIFLVVLLLFGAKRLPEIGASLGKGIREFKGSLREIEKEVATVSEATYSTVTRSSLGLGGAHGRRPCSRSRVGSKRWSTRTQSPIPRQ